MFLPLSEKINNSKLLDNFDIIRNDMISLWKEGYFSDYKHSLDELRDSPTKTNVFWQVCPLMYKRKEWPNLSSRIKESNTLEIVKNLGVQPVLSIFSYIAPGGEVVPHTDHDDELVENSKDIPHELRTNSVVKYHFSLDIPEDGESALIVGDEKRILKNGCLNPFDETTIHTAYNHSPTTPRGALIISFLKTDLY